MLTEITTGQFRVEPLTNAGALAGLADSWNALAGDVPFRRWEWLEAWWRHYRRKGMELFVLSVRDDDGELVGLAPWYLSRSNGAGRVVRFLGSGQVCSDELTIFSAPGCGDVVAQHIARWLSSDSAGLWDAIVLDGVRADDEWLNSLAGAMASRGHAVHRRERVGAWRLELPDDWATYTMRLSKSRRRGVRTIEKHYFDPGLVACKSVEREDQLEHGLAILRELHQRRRVSLGDPGCFASPCFDGFLTETARRFHELGQLRLHWVELDGRPVAAQFDIVSGDTCYLYQSGIDPDAIQDKPGWLIQIAALRWAIDQRLRAVDFLRGDEPYKSWWRAERRGLSELRIVGRGATARARYQAWLYGARVKGWLRDAASAARRLRSFEGSRDVNPSVPQMPVEP
jgi:CelD/BcsL family acetyltransferase involved in cellulose biosynthesis